MENERTIEENEDSYTRETVKESIREIASTMFSISKFDESQFEEIELKEDILCDDLDIIEMVMNLEDEFGVMITDEDSEKMETFGDCIDIVCAKLGVN